MRHMPCKNNGLKLTCQWIISVTGTITIGVHKRVFKPSLLFLSLHIPFNLKGAICGHVVRKGWNYIEVILKLLSVWMQLK